MKDSDKRRISPETISLTLIALVDCSTTAWLIRSGLAVEGNPVVRYYIERGWAWFFALKLLILAPMYVIDLHRAIDRTRMRLYLRAAVLVYASIYGLGMLAQYKRFVHKPRPAAEISASQPSDYQLRPKSPVPAIADLTESARPN